MLRSGIADGLPVVRLANSSLQDCVISKFCLQKFGKKLVKSCCEPISLQGFGFTAARAFDRLVLHDSGNLGILKVYHNTLALTLTYEGV